MKVLFDATWIARYFGQNMMNGGLRLKWELAKRLVNSSLCETYLTTTVLEIGYKQNLEKFLQEICKIKDNRLGLNYPLILKIDDQIRDLTYLKRTGRGFLIRNLDLSFASDKLLNEFNVYHSSIEAIPDIIKENKKIRPFYTSLDLIALYRPEVAPPGSYEYMKPFYDSIDERTIVLAISESTRNDLLNYRKDIKPENVVVTYIAADSDMFFPNKGEAELQKVKEKYNIKYDNYFLMLNRIQKYKNTGHTLKCFDQVLKSGELKDTGIIVIGTFYENEEAQNLLKKYGNNPQIQFIEYVADSDLSVLYSNAVCFLYLSLYEGFGLPILEAMLCGTPVICSNTSSMPEVIGDCGITVDPTSEDELCDAIVKVANNPDLRKLFSEQGLKRAGLFSWDKYADDVISAYKKFQYNS